MVSNHPYRYFFGQLSDGSLEWMEMRPDGVTNRRVWVWANGEMRGASSFEEDRSAFQADEEERERGIHREMNDRHWNRYITTFGGTPDQPIPIEELLSDPSVREITAGEFEIAWRDGRQAMGHEP